MRTRAIILRIDWKQTILSTSKYYLHCEAYTEERLLTDNWHRHSVDLNIFYFLEIFMIDSTRHGSYANINLSRPNIPETKMESRWFWEAIPRRQFCYSTSIRLGNWVINLVVLDSPSLISTDKEWKMFSQVIGSQIHDHPSLAWASYW